MVNVVSGGKSVQLIAGEKLVLPSGLAAMVKEKITGKLHNYYRSKEFVCDDTPHCIILKEAAILQYVINSR